MDDDIPKVTPFERVFCEEILKDLRENISAAYKRAGGTAKSHYTAASEMRRKPHIDAYIEHLKKDRNERNKVDADALLHRLVAMADADPSDIFDDHDNVLPISEWPIEWRRQLNGFDVAELFEREAEGKRIKVGDLKKLKWVSREKIMDMLGRHISIGAFKDKVEVTASDELADMLREARERASGH